MASAAAAEGMRLLCVEARGGCAASLLGDAGSGSRPRATRPFLAIAPISCDYRRLSCLSNQPIWHLPPKSSAAMRVRRKPICGRVRLATRPKGWGTSG
eukprot:4705929-Pleurochrysis_carterae.AAC.1